MPKRTVALVTKEPLLKWLQNRKVEGYLHGGLLGPSPKDVAPFPCSPMVVHADSGLALVRRGGGFACWLEVVALTRTNRMPLKVQKVWRVFGDPSEFNDYIGSTWGYKPPVMIRSIDELIAQA